MLSYGNTKVTNTVFSNNTATNDGGAFDGLSGKPVLINCVFLDSTATNFNGGALRFAGGAAAIVTNCTFWKNQAAQGDAVYTSDNGTATLGNCIVWDAQDSTSGNEIINYGGAALPVTYSDVFGGYPGVGNINTDPQYTNTSQSILTLVSGSPCIGAGSPKVADFSLTDIDGVARDKKHPDMGAYESH